MVDRQMQEIRRLHKKVAAADRRIALMNLPGKVAEKDPAKRTLRLRIGQTADGRDILGPPVRWQEATAGGMRIHSEPDMEEQMTLISPSGTVGASSIAGPATYDRDHEAPSDSSDTAVFERGRGRIEIGPDGVTVIGDFRAKGGTFEHDEVYVGKDHVHTKVQPGGALSGPPPT